VTSPQQPKLRSEADGVSNTHDSPPDQASAEYQRASMKDLLWITTGASQAAPLLLNGGTAAPKRSKLPAPAATAQSNGRHRAPGERHGIRFLAFGAIGAAVFAAGLGIQIALVHYLHVDPVAAYVIQGVFSIELSFVLNRYLTWRDRSVPFFRALWRFNTQKAIATVLNMVAYAILVRLGVQYIVANIALTAVFTPLNYVAAHYWSFEARPHGTTMAKEVPAATNGHLPARAVGRLPRGPLPTVCAVIPCKNNPDTIRATVDALLLQDYPSLEEIIVVGDVGDPTWTALADVRDPRLSTLEQEPTSDRRDPNVKRDKGIRKSRCDLIALVDSDIVMDTDWLSWAVVMLLEQGGGLVAGGMRSIHDTFWGRFVDRNVLAAKTPRLSRPYYVTAENFGKRGFKPPITANAVFPRKLYEACPLDVAWDYGYEDYEWFWRLTQADHKILFSGRLTAAHHHRTSFRLLAREYRRSAQGCARFIRAHRECPLARKRLRQATLLPLAALTGLAGLVAAARTGHLAEVGVLLGAAVALLVVREISNARSVEAAVYPAAGLALGAMFAGSLLSSLGQIAISEDTVPADDPDAETEVQPSPPQLPEGRRLWPLAAILSVQAAISLSLVWSNTAFGEEARYLLQGRLQWAHWLHGSPAPPITGGGAPQIYPPLGALADSLAGLAGARILSLCFMLGATALLYLVTQRLFGDWAAIIGAALWAVSESVLRLAFATPEALGCLFIALAAWVVIQAGVRSRQGEFVALAALLLGLASMTSFSSLLLVPAVVAFAFFVWQSMLGTRMAIWSTCWLAGGTAVLVLGSFAFLHLWADAIHSTFSRPSGTPAAGVAPVLRAVWSWDGLMLALAAVGVIAAFTSAGSRNRRLLLLTLFASVLLVPAYQVAIGTGSWLLDQRMPAGTWFLAMGAGCAAATLAPLGRWKAIVSVGIVALFLIYPVVNGTWYARSTFHMWPKISNFVTELRPLVDGNPGPILVSASNDTVEILNYYRIPAVDLRSQQAANNLGRDIRAAKYPFVVLQLNGSFNSADLPEAALRSSRSGLANEILQLASGSGQSSLARELENSPNYAIKLTIPYQTSSTASSTGIFVVWQRSPAQG
jgi:putative flippase GtrA